VASAPAAAQEDGPPYTFDPSRTYADPNVQAWAQYYAQGGTDPAGAVYFVSVPGVTGPAPASGAAGAGAGAQAQVQASNASAGGGGANVQRAGSYQAQGTVRAGVQRSGSYQAGGAQQQQQHQPQPQQHQQSALANATRYQLTDSGFPRSSAGSEAAAPQGQQQAQGGYFGANHGAAAPVSTSPTPGSPIAQPSTPSWVLPKKVTGGQKPVGAV
jgi:signal transducing adaptor molecule